jgi:hypothetical protein
MQVKSFNKLLLRTQNSWHLSCVRWRSATKSPTALRRRAMRYGLGEVVSSEEVEIPPVWKALSKNLFIVVVTAVSMAFVFDFSLPELAPEVKRKCTQIGTFLNLMAALFLAYKFIQQGRYKSRELELYKKDDRLTKQFELAKHSIYAQEQFDSWAQALNEEREKIYSELRNIFSLDRLESAHIILGLALVCIGSFLQMIGSG